MLRLWLSIEHSKSRRCCFPLFVQSQTSVPHSMEVKIEGDDIVDRRAIDLA